MFNRVLIVFLGVVFAAPVFSGVAITYQGQLQQQGQPFSGAVNLEFRLFDAAAGGSQVGNTVVRNDWPVNDGLFLVELDFGQDAFDGEDRYLQVIVNGTALEPRQAVGATPLALFALNTPSPSPWQRLPTNHIHYSTGRVGIGTSTPAAGLHTRVPGGGGILSVTDGSGGVRAIQGESTSTQGLNMGVLGIARSSMGIGVQGFVGPSSPAGDPVGVWGSADFNPGGGTGVFGEASGPTGIGVRGRAHRNSSATIGVKGEVNSPEGFAAHFTGPDGSRNYFERRVGIHTTTPQAQLHVQADGSVDSLRLVRSNGIESMRVTNDGRVGIGTTSPASSLEVRSAGSTDVLRLTRSNGTEALRVTNAGNMGLGTTSPGARLDATAPSGNVIRATHSNGHFGIVGDANAGVFGQRGGAGFTARAWLGHSNNIGILAQGGTLAGGVAGRFEGNVNVTGTLTKGGGSFKIDHPLDPTNKYLFHSFVESPDMLNIYNGNVTTDRAGFAEVELPDYFEALNIEFRYQLTVIGTFAQAIVAEEIKGNRFVIATDQPGVKVSWMVTGIRNDPWAKANRIKPVVPKPGHERGQLLHPEAWQLTESNELP